MMRAIRSLYETRRLQDARSDQRRGQLLRPVRALRATAGFAYFHEGEDWNAKIRSFDGIASMPLTSHKSQSRPSSAPRAGGPPGIPRTPRRSPSFEAGGQSQIPVSRKVQKSASRPWSARSAQTRATSATSLSSFSKEDATAPSAPRSDATGSGRERRCPECTADSACLNCASAPERPLLRGKRPSDALLLGRRRRFRPAKCRSQRPPVEPQVQRPTPEEEDALRQWKQAQIRDWLRRKDAEMLWRGAAKATDLATAHGGVETAGATDGDGPPDFPGLKLLKGGRSKGTLGRQDLSCLLDASNWTSREDPAYVPLLQ